MIKVDASGNFAIRLRDQAASTGYSWQVKYPQKSVTFLKEERLPGLLPGAPGTRVLYYHASRLPATLRLSLKRPWEPRPIERRQVKLVAA